MLGPFNHSRQTYGHIAVVDTDIRHVKYMKRQCEISREMRDKKTK